MVRGIQVQLRWLLLLLPLNAAALSLGDMVVSSMPGEPLRAHIPYTLLPGEGLTEVHVTIATAEEYARRHIPRADMLQGLRLALLDKGEGKGHLQLFGEQPWQGEAAELLFMVNWSKGQMERHYQLVAVAPTAVSAGNSAPNYVEVAQDETLDEIAIRLSKGRNRSYLHMMYALFQANPAAFYRGNMNNLKSGQTLRVPSDAELYALSDREVFAGIRLQYEQWQQLRESTGQRATQAGEALAGMSEEQASGLDLTGDSVALQQRLAQVASESEAIRRENEALRQRLAVLEQRVQNVAGQVLEYAEAKPPAAEVTTPAPQDRPQPRPEATSQPPAEEGLGATAMAAAILLVLLFALYIWYSTGHPHRGRS